MPNIVVFTGIATGQRKKDGRKNEGQPMATPMATPMASPQIAHDCPEIMPLHVNILCETGGNAGLLRGAVFRSVSRHP